MDGGCVQMCVRGRASRVGADSEWIRQRHVENKFGEYCGGITAGANMMSLNTKV